MSEDERLTVPQVAELLGIKPGTWRAYTFRGQAPAADGQYDARTPWWRESTVTEWDEAGRPKSAEVAHAEHSCNRQDVGSTYVCTLPERHDGQHVASDGSRVVARWA